jgi:hypothetical protein
VVLASVDPPSAQLAMNARWHLPFRWVSDPSGERLVRPLEGWNADERRGLFHPLVLLLAPDGEVLVRHRSRDFSDRPDDRDVLEALASLRLPARTLPAPWAPEGVNPEPTASAFRSEGFGAYFRGLKLGTKALAGRMRDEQDEPRCSRRRTWPARSSTPGRSGVRPAADTGLRLRGRPRAGAATPR